MNILATHSNHTPKSMTRRSHRLLVACALGALITPATPAAHAQDLEPRSYSNTPVGMNFLVTGYSYTDGTVSVDPSVPLEDGEVEVHSSLYAYARAFEVLGRSAKVDVVVPYVWASGSATFQGAPEERAVEGLGDPRLRFSLNVDGAPALTLEEFADYEQDVIVGLSLQLVAPLGEYEKDKLLNIGTNRWSLKPELGVSKKWQRLVLELTMGATLYTDNEDFLGHQELEKDPLYSVQTHVIYTIWRHVWGALVFRYYGGGKQRVDGDSVGERQENTRVGATLALPLSRHMSLKIFGSTGTSARIGGDFDTIGVAWQVRFGGGL